MNRIVLMVLKNILKVPGLYSKLCHYAKHTEEYPEEEKFDHIAKIMNIAVKSKCPVIPVALIDCFKVLDQKGSKPVTVQIHYLKPIPYEEYQGMKAAQLAELVKARIEETITAYA